ncbi:lipoprotein 16 [Achromobacter marplatensis]|nr:lipoprotein 16 [Achromobacter marplatensis]
MFQLAFSRMALRIVATLLASGMVAACGYKGPLYMPTPDGKPPARTPSQPTQPIPPAPTIP